MKKYNFRVYAESDDHVSVKPGEKYYAIVFGKVINRPGDDVIRIEKIISNSKSRRFKIGQEIALNIGHTRFKTYYLYDTFEELMAVHWMDVL